jgi:hypothetical protein
MKNKVIRILMNVAFFLLVLTSCNSGMETEVFLENNSIDANPLKVFASGESNEVIISEKSSKMKVTIINNGEYQYNIISGYSY